MRHARRTSAPPTRSRAIAALAALLLTSGIGVTAAYAVPADAGSTLDEVAELQSAASQGSESGTEVPGDGVNSDVPEADAPDAPFTVEVIEPTDGVEVEGGAVEGDGLAEVPEPDVSEGAARGVEAQSLEAQAVALAAGPNPAVRPTPTGSNTVLRITAGGVRAANGDVSGLAGATYYAQQGTAATNPGANNPASGATKYTCQYPTDLAGVCYIIVPNRTGSSSGNANGYWVTQESAPTGWTSLAALGTGNYESAKTETPYRFFIGPVSGTSNTYEVPDDAATNGNRQNGPFWANLLDNPAYPAKCGINIAMVVDQSTSVSSSEMAVFRTALNSFVSALSGTSSRAAVYTFGTNATRSQALTSIDSSALATAITNATTWNSTIKYTNWDAAFQSVAGHNVVTGGVPTYDLVLLLTDGDPTMSNSSAYNATVRFQPNADAIFSANTVKSAGTKVVGVGVGMTTNSDLNLKAVSGPTINSDYFLSTNFAGLSAKLKEIASINCGGKISIEKQAIDQGGNRISPNPVESNGIGFTLTTTSGTITPTITTGVASGQNGWAEATYTLANGATSTKITITEVPGARFDFAEAVCRVNGVIPSGAVQGPNSYTFTATPGAIVTCGFENILRPSVTVTKNWVVNGVSYPGTASLPANSIVGARTAQLTLNRAPANSTAPLAFATPYTYATTASLTVGETVSPTLPAGCTLNASYTSTAGATINATTGVTGVLVNGTNAFTITNTITCASSMTIDKKAFDRTNLPALNGQMTPAQIPSAGQIASGSSVVSGKSVAFIYTVVNTGPTDLTQVKVTDNRKGSVAVCTIATLAPGATATCAWTPTTGLLKN